MADPFELDKDRNPCTYKGVCIKCKAVAPEDRPTRCLQIACKQYTPCNKCSRNMDLKDGFCRWCSPDASKTVITTPDGSKASIPNLPPTHPLLQSKSAVPVQGNASVGTIRKITFPGTAPELYSQDEKDYYNEQWISYKGFYRDPSVYGVAHQIILLEIELNHVSNEMMLMRGEVSKDLENKQQRLIENMKSLRNMLPAKDALDASRDEMMINKIYDNYIAEIQNKKVGGVSRFITTDAIALAPYVEYPMDPMELAQKLGYRLVDLTTAIDQIVQAKDIPSEPLKLLEFFGFFLKQTYALQDSIPQGDEPLDTEEDVDEEAIAELSDEPEIEPKEEQPKPKPLPPANNKMGFSITSGEDDE